jgi:DNA-binding MarR family transcriptional regulator
MGLSQGDHKALDLINDGANTGAPLTAGQLAEATGLTTGAITGLIDRLEQAKLVRRAPDPQDRRKVVLEPTRERDAELWTLFSGISASMTEMTGRYTDAELEVISDFMRHSIELTTQETQRLREAT